MARRLQIGLRTSKTKILKFKIKRRLTAMANAPVKAIKKGKKLGAVKPLTNLRPLTNVRPLTRVS